MRCSLAAHGCQIGQDRLNLGLARVMRLLHSVKPIEVFDPIDISLFGSAAIVQPSESAHVTEPAVGLT